MNSHDGANISRKISSACCHGKIFHWIQAIGVDHEVSVVFVDSWCLAAITVVEEFRQRLFLKVVDLMHVEPGTVAW